MTTDLRADLTAVRRTVIELIVRADDNDAGPAVIDSLADALLALNAAAELLADADPLEPDVTISVTKVP